MKFSFSFQWMLYNLKKKNCLVDFWVFFFLSLFVWNQKLFVCGFWQTIRCYFGFTTPPSNQCMNGKIQRENHANNFSAQSRMRKVYSVHFLVLIYIKNAYGCMFLHMRIKQLTMHNRKINRFKTCHYGHI